MCRKLLTILNIESAAADDNEVSRKTYIIKENLDDYRDTDYLSTNQIIINKLLFTN